VIENTVVQAGSTFITAIISEAAAAPISCSRGAAEIVFHNTPTRSRRRLIADNDRAGHPSAAMGSSSLTETSVRGSEKNTQRGGWAEGGIKSEPLVETHTHTHTQLRDREATQRGF